MKKLIGLKDIRYELDKLKAVPHILFTGPRGTGKTTLGNYIAETRDKKVKFVTGNTLKKTDVLNLFVNIREGDIILIDEIHRLNPAVEEVLYQPMETGKLPIQDISGNTMEFPLPQFSLIGTTTKSAAISKPLMSRFQITFHIPHYNLRELTRIVLSNYNDMPLRSALQIAGNVVTPREAINLAFRVTQLGDDIEQNLKFIGYKLGVSRLERQYLKVVQNVGKISLASLVSAMQVDEDEVRFVEDKLIQKRLIQISSRGRTLTVNGMMKLKDLAI